MSKEQMVKYFTHIDLLESIENELKQMHEDDLYLVLDTLLPEGTDIDIAVKEIIEWKNLTN
jgi:hypothetical protein